MGIVTDKPAGLAPTPNDLDNIPDDLLGPVPAVLQAFGKDLLIMEKPPQPGEVLKIEILLRCKEEGRELLDGGDFKYYRKCKSLGAKVTVEPYKPEDESEDVPEPDPAMIDENGQIPDDEPEDEPEDGPALSGLDEFDPAFSHNGTPR